MRNRRMLPLLLAGILTIAAPISVLADDFQAEIAGLQAQQQIQESSLAAAQQNIVNLEAKKLEMESCLYELNSQYDQATSDVEELALKAGEKAEELKRIKVELQRARVEEKEQYEAMKLRMVYLYENGGSTYLETLFSCESIAEFLNRAEYIQQIADYDREMLEKYEATRNEISQKEVAIQKEVEDINALRAESAAKQQEVRDLAASANASIADYAQQIASSEQEAQVLLAQIAQSQANVNSLMMAAWQNAAQEQVQEETAVYPEENTMDSGSDSSDSSVDMTEDTVDSGSDSSVDMTEDTYTPPAVETPVVEDTASSGGQGTYLGNFTLTAYCGCAQCCGTAGQPTASGVMPTSGHTVAMAGVPFGTQLLINGVVYTVEDAGTPYGHVDIYFDTHDAALAFGLQSAEVYQL